MQKKLGQGSFGDLYVGQHKDTGVKYFFYLLRINLQ